MRKLFAIVVLIGITFWTTTAFSQNSQDTTKVYKKRVLENTEIDLLSSYYYQDGDNAAVTGGIGTEELTDFATSISVLIPLNDDDVLTIDATISAYSSASSSNLNPSYENNGNGGSAAKLGTPWAASSGASKKDSWKSLTASYSHSSDDRNKIWGANFSISAEYDYFSLGFGGNYTYLFNQKNTELGIKANIYLDNWSPLYPIEINEFTNNNGDLNSSIFNGVDILDANGDAIDKNATGAWSPINNTLIEDTKRNTYSVSLSLSQILSKKAQFSIFLDLVQQDGWLANPMQRVYFADKSNFYIGNASSIPNYTSYSNQDVFQLADDIERLPTRRFKVPVGLRFNYFVNEVVVLKTYYRYYFDDWGVNSHTFNVSLPIKIAAGKFTLYPSYRYYNQTKADYFAPYEEHLSTEEFYTSDYDLSEFNSSKYGFGIKYTDIFTKFHLGKMKMKSINLNYSSYTRNTGLNAYIISLGAKFIFDKK